MKDDSQTANDRSPSTGSAALCTAIALQGVLVLLWVVTSPSESGSAVLLGFSALRLLMICTIGALTAAWGILASSAWRRGLGWDRVMRVANAWGRPPVRAFSVFAGLFTLFVALFSLLVLSRTAAASELTLLKTIVARAAPVLIWLELTLLLLWIGLFLQFPQKFCVRTAGGKLFTPWRIGILLAVASLIGIAAAKLYLLATWDLRYRGLEWVGPLVVAALLLVLGVLQLQLDGKRRAAYYLWAGLLFSAGALLWGYFLGWGQVLYSFFDWAKITDPRLAFLQQALQQGVLPLHVSDASLASGLTDRYLAIPDVILSPQVLLLRWLGIAPFILADILLMYALGFAGLVWFCVRRNLSGLSLTILFLLYNFNGSLVAHLSVGHLTWAATFLLTWLLVLVFDLVDGPVGWKWVMQASLLMFVLLLQGGYHHYLYTLLLLVFLTAALPRHIGVIAKTIGFSLFLGAFRLVPVAVSVSSLQKLEFLAGYPYGASILDALVHPAVPGELTNYSGVTGSVGVWETTLYVGLAGVLFLAVFGVVAVLRRREKPNSYAALLVPVVGLTILSLDQVFQALITILPVPPLSGERVPLRMFGLAFILLLALAIIEFERWYQTRKASIPFLAVCAGFVIFLSNDLWQNFRAWQMSSPGRQFEVLPFDPVRWVVANHPDPAYFTALWVGLVVTLLSLGMVVFLGTRKAKAEPAKQIPLSLTETQL